MSARCNPARAGNLCLPGLALAAAVCLMPPAHGAPCAKDLDVAVPPDIERPFDPIHESLRLRQTITLSNALSRPCRAQVILRAVAFSANWPDEASLIIRDAAGRLLLRATPGDPPEFGEPRPLSVPPADDTTLALDIRLENPGALLRAGTYQAAIELIPSPAGPVSADPDSVHRFTAGFEIRSSVRIALSQDTPRTRIALGELHPGLRKRFGVLVTATNAYSLSVRSQNDWHLERLNGSQATDERAPYQFLVDGQTASGDSGFETIHARIPQGTRGHAFEVITGEFGVLRHGKYQDVITVTIAARP